VRSPYRARQPFTARRFFGGVLKALGLAYLFNLMFGWAPAAAHSASCCSRRSSSSS
jgi:hypothetical protein